MENARKALLLLVAGIGTLAIALQLWLNLTRNLDHSILWRLIDFFSYFTNTTGILVTAVAILALIRPASKPAQPGAITAAAIYMLVVCVTYETLLRGELHGLAFLASLALHEVMPALTVLLWLVFTPKAGQRWREPLCWLIYPALYIAWILARGAAVHRYPYFFADVDKLGYPRALATAAGFLATFYILGLGAVACGRLWPQLFLFRFAPERTKSEV